MNNNLICSLISTGFEKYSQKDKYIKSLQRIIELLYFKGFRDFCIPASPGIPLWAGHMIADMKEYLKISLRVYAPYDEITYGRNFRERRDLYDLLDRADSFIPIGRRRTENCFKECEEALADVCDLLVLIDGDISSPCDRSVIKYAYENNIPMIHEIIEVGN